MQVAKKRFEENISRIHHINDIYIHLKNHLNFNESDISDICRSELVYLVSALDRLIHDLVRAGMIETYQGKRVPTNAYLKFSITLEQLDLIVNSSIVSPEIVFEQHIMSAHKHLAFQEPDKISSALSLIWSEEHKWQKIAQKLGMNEKDIKIKLKNIVIRRNQIVHEADMDLLTGNIQVIIDTDIEDSIDFISKSTSSRV